VRIPNAGEGLTPGRHQPVLRRVVELGMADRIDALRKKGAVA
jgi:hypothetical protein